MSTNIIIINGKGKDIGLIYLILVAKKNFDHKTLKTVLLEVGGYFKDRV